MLPILLNGENIGTAQLADGKITASCPFEKDHIYRLQLCYNDGRVLPLGVMMPRKERFVLEKGGIDISLCARCEVLRSMPGEPTLSTLPFALSHGRAIPSTGFISDPLLAECLGDTADVKLAYITDKRYIYFPFYPNKPCPMAPFLFCLTVFDTPMSAFAVFRLDEKDMPIPL